MTSEERRRRSARPGTRRQIPIGRVGAIIPDDRPHCKPVPFRVINWGMRVIIAGDRRWYAPDLARQVVNRLLRRHGPQLVIVHGGGDGIDRAFAEACFDLRVEQKVHFAQWDDLGAPGAVIAYYRDGRPYNSNAEPPRNAEMVAAGAEMCIAFHRFLASSKGTKDCVRRAIEAGIPTFLIDSDKAQPRRVRKGHGRSG